MSGKKRGKAHIVDILFPILLLLLMSLFSLATVAFSAGFYKRSVESVDAHFATRTCITYVTQKLRQFDATGSIGITDLDGNDCVKLTEQIAGKAYCTYLYAYDGSLRELYVKDTVTPKASMGKKIIDIDTFNVTIKPHGLIMFMCTDKSGKTASTYYGSKCHIGENYGE